MVATERTAVEHSPGDRLRDLRTPVAWGVVWGIVQAASPLAFFWLPPATVYALSLPLIAAVYLGFAVADGRRHVLAVETAVASVFVVVAAAAITGTRLLCQKEAPDGFGAKFEEETLKKREGRHGTSLSAKRPC